MSKEPNNETSKICIIRSNPVRPDPRVEKEALTLANAGYHVHILAWDRDSNAHEVEDVITVSNINIPITRLGYKASYGEGFKNIKPYLAFQFHIRKWLKKHDFDIVHACDFDTAFFSLGVVRKKKKKFIFDIFDFLFDAPKSIFEKCIKKLQFYLINSADATIICTEERKKQIEGSQPKNLCVIHNSPCKEQIGNAVFKIKETTKIKIAYVGILQDYRLLKEIAEVISQSKEYELHMGGIGKYHTYFKNLSKKNSNINYYGCLSYEQTLALEKQCDIMVGIYDPAISNHRFAAPNKFYESLMLGKPIIMVNNTGMSNIVKEYNIGVLIEYSKVGFQEGLKQLCDRRDEWTLMGNKMEMLYQQFYSWSIMESRLLKLYKKILQDK